ncbi:MAG: RraA family protein [Actinomycetota bacterium]|jgi:4-hydroxy-4-methyl-2-oxoglutarate aldolase|nr:RraA family protein [Actinomycetota bacterium]
MGGTDRRAGPGDLADLAKALGDLGAATLGESGGLAMHSRVRPVWPGASLVGPAYTVRCAPGDNLAVHAAVTRAPAGSILVVDVGPIARRGYWGEVLTTGAEARGISGLVIDGGVRDTAALEAHRFAVFATTVALPGATKVLPGATGGTVRVGGVPVSAGDWIVGDGDGVVVVALHRLEQVVAAARERASKEERMFGELRDGRTTVELLGLDAGLIADLEPPVALQRDGGSEGR